MGTPRSQFLDVLMALRGSLRRLPSTIPYYLPIDLFSLPGVTTDKQILNASDVSRINDFPEELIIDYVTDHTPSPQWKSRGQCQYCGELELSHIITHHQNGYSSGELLNLIWVAWTPVGDIQIHFSCVVFYHSHRILTILTN